jgi:transcriptional regulator with XRE-family HTH domain
VAEESGRTFGPWYKQYRLAAGLTQDEVAAITGLHKVTISRIENGQPLTEETAANLARAVGAPVEEAISRSSRLSKDPLEPTSDAERRAILIVRRVPSNKRTALLRALDAIADAMTLE